jgi:2-polyprenyl-3-methyl-5-hydroxy-6-metoxy-1,4-benzoquinol methylase
MGHVADRSACPGCGENSSSELLSRPFLSSSIQGFLVDFYRAQGSIEIGQLKGADYVLAECRGCGLIWQRFILDEFLMHRLYEQWIDPSQSLHRHRQYGLDNYISYAEEIMKILAFFHRIPAKIRVLDFGTGWCEWIRMAHGFGCEAYGTDLAKAKLDYAATQGIRTVALEAIPEASFDVIHTEQVFEHLPNPREILFKLAAALRPGGLLKVSVPNADGIRMQLRRLPHDFQPARFRNDLLAVQPLEHINSFSRDPLIKMASMCGLQPIRFSSKVTWGYQTIRTLVQTIRATLGRTEKAARGLCVFFTKGT